MLKKSRLCDHDHREGKEMIMKAQAQVGHQLSLAAVKNDIGNGISFDWRSAIGERNIQE